MSETPTGPVLVTGGVRSGKSAHAERLLAERSDVTYIATGAPPDDARGGGDPDWRARVERHRSRRPEGWRTVETTLVAQTLATTTGAVLVDCLGTWLTGIVDDAELWDAATEEIEELVAGRVTGLVAALRAATEPVVLVTNEVGLGVVPDHRSGRLFRDLLGFVNQRVAGVCDEVHLVVAGRVLRI